MINNIVFINIYILSINIEHEDSCEGHLPSDLFTWRSLPMNSTRLMPASRRMKRSVSTMRLDRHSIIPSRRSPTSIDMGIVYLLPRHALMRSHAACISILAWSGMGSAGNTPQPAYALPFVMDLGGCVCVTPLTSHPKRKSVILHLYQLGV